MGITTLVFVPATVPYTFLLPLGVRHHLQDMYAIVSLYYSSRMEYGQLISNRQLGLMIGVDWSYCQMACFILLEILNSTRNLTVLFFPICPRVLIRAFDSFLVE